MAPPRKPERRSFFMPPAVTPEQQGTTTDDKVIFVLREIRALRTELHQFSEDIMKLSQLSDTIDRLIATASTIKHRADNPPAPAEQPDDPAVEELNAKIERAIAVLEGREGEPVVRTDGIGREIDPNAPA